MSLKTSIYLSQKIKGKIPTKVELRKDIVRFLLNNKIDDYKIIKSKQHKKERSIIEYNNLYIDFKLNYLVSNEDDKRILLSFFPIDENTASWTNKENKIAVNVTLNFIASIGNKLEINLTGSKIIFDNQIIKMDDMIDIGNWKATLSSPDSPRQEKINDLFNPQSDINVLSEDLNDFLKPGLFEWILNNLYKENKFFPFSKNYSEKDKEIKIIKSFLGNFGEFGSINNIEISKSFCASLPSKEKTILLFIDNKEIASWYNKNRLYFILNDMPTQMILAQETSPNLGNIKKPGIKSNLLLEMQIKMGIKPIALLMPDYLLNTDGFLCLESIETAHQKLFGILLTYSKFGEEKDECVHIYPDIDFSIVNDEVHFPQLDNLISLSENIRFLYGRSGSVNIIITKKWKRGAIKRLVRELNERKINVKNIYYISSRTSRFVDEFIIYNDTRTIHPYMIINEKTAFLRTTTSIRIYPNISQIYIELIWPIEKNIEKSDLESILWLVKKRIYRISEFDVLKLPEPVYMFKKIKELKLTNTQTKLKIPLRFLL